MRKRWIAAALVVLPAGIAVWSSAGFLAQPAVSSQSGPLIVTPAELDVQSETGEEQHVEFRLSNSGSDRLTIREVRTTCACTVASPLERYELGPGDETVLRVQLVPPSFGSREAAITLVTDSAAVPALRIPIRLRGRTLSPPYFRTCPDEIRYSSADAGEVEISFVVQCLEKKDEPPWLTAFKGESSGITVTAPTVLATNVLDETAVYREYELTLRLAAPDAGGAALTDVLRPQTRTEAMRPLPMIPVTISRQAAVRAVPSTLLVRRHDLADGAWQRRVLLVSATSEEWAVTGIEPSASWLTAELVGETGAGRLLEITLLSPPPEGDGPSEASLRITTTHANCAELTISIVVD